MNEQQIREDLKTLKTYRGHQITLEELKPNQQTETYLRNLAGQGTPERYSVVSHVDRRKKRPFSYVKMDKAGGVCISMLLRPVLRAERCGLITSMAALAIAKTVEHHSDAEIKIRWVGDVLCGHKCIGAAKAEGAIRGNGFFEHLILTVQIATPSSIFRERLSDTLQEVFGGKPYSLEASICESFLVEFFDLYEDLNGRGSHLDEYRSHSSLLGCIAHIRRGRKSIPVKVKAINQNAQLVVAEKGSDTEILLNSPSEIIW